jgi:hypothetical protein
VTWNEEALEDSFPAAQNSVAVVEGASQNPLRESFVEVGNAHRLRYP